MDVNYIIVQAGGKGTRMEYLTANKPKALVPINNLPMLFHLFKKYPEKRFLIISDYKMDVMKKYLDAFSPVKYLIVNAQGKKGTCGGLKSAINMIPENEPFMLIWSDLVLPESFELPEKTDNYVGLSKTFQCRWRYQDKQFEEIPSTENGVAGFFLFKDKSVLENVPEEGEFVRWMKDQGFVFDTVGLYSTKEYGLISEWKKLKDSNTDSRCRPFNSLRIEDNKIIKEGIDEQGKSLAVREKAWYKFVMDKGYKQIPQIYDYNPLTMQKINGHNIFDYKLSYEDRKTILDLLVKSLKELHEFGSAPTDYFSIWDAYVGKTFKRLHKIRDMVPFADQHYIRINGKNCRNVFFYQNKLKEKFVGYRCKEFKFLHGDNTFSNMMLDENMQPIMIDPRGYFGYTEMFGDVAYDWAKLYYSLVGNYDQFNLKRFQLEINDEEVKLQISSNGWEDLEEYFLELIKDEVSAEDIRLIHAVIWLSLTTYAWEDYDSICGAFYNGIYYLEDVL